MMTTAGSQPVIHPSKPLQQELLRLLATAPFWNKDLEWLQSRAAVQALLPKAVTGKAVFLKSDVLLASTRSFISFKRQ